MQQELSTTYQPLTYEKKWYAAWEKDQVFSSPVDPSKKPYTILMPPPNVTAQLHMGHGTTYTIQDILVRWKRMQGFNALWLPGTDHAGIATQMMVEKSIEAEEGKTRHDIGRVELLKRLEAWKEKYGGMITNQFRSLGFSCDWSKEAYTMDPKLSLAVRAIFVDLYKSGLIYRGERLVNWDPALKTAISDDEIEMVEMNATLWTFRYPLEDAVNDQGEAFIDISTTRPETMLGDTAVAVNPEDPRYKKLIGKKIRLPITGRLIPIVGDDYVSMEFGTGCVKITPAHDPNDFEIGKRHSLAMINIMNDDATLNDQVPAQFVGLDRFVARKEVVKAMKGLGLFVKDETHRNAVPHSDRSKAIIEPRLSKQWFVKMKSLAGPAIDAANDGRVNFHPNLWKKTYLHWLENIQDWCISRQIWWGHRIPIWYCKSCHGVTTGLEDPSKCEHCASKDIIQDEDVLDTWFSSWLWPISPFGWPKESQELKYFYPTDTLVSANEILFLWVARMVMVGMKTRGDVPFKDVYIAATICDKQGRKFSKTLGNGIDPLDIIAKHGTDALRFTGVWLSPLGGRVKMDAADFDHGARFVNKLWNSARYLLKIGDTSLSLQKISTAHLGISEKWLLSEFQETSSHVNGLLDQFRVNEAIAKMYQFVWGAFCDWGLECSKDRLQSDDQNVRLQSTSVLFYVFEGILRLLSPVMPFITEELWHLLPIHPDWKRKKYLMQCEYPLGKDQSLTFEREHGQWQIIQSLITEVRSVRALANINPKDLVDLQVSCASGLGTVIKTSEGLIKRLANAGSVVLRAESTKPTSQCLVAIGKGFEVYIPAEGLIDVQAEKKRLSSEEVRVTKILQGLNAKLANPSFVERAPEEVLSQTKEQISNMTTQLESLKKNLASLN